MMHHSLAVAALLTTAFAPRSFAQTNFNEIEPNSLKSEATVVAGMTAGDTITGFSTGAGAVLGDTSVLTNDMFRVKTAALPLGIYRHRLALATPHTSSHTGTIRGVAQSGAPGTNSTGGTAGTVDSAVQTSTSLSTPQRIVQWYAFGKEEEIYYRVSGTSLGTANYVASLSTDTILATVIATPFESSSPITISTIDVTTVNTTIHVFDANLDALPGFSNDDEGPVGPTQQSRLTRTFAPGTYYVAVSTSGTSWKLPAPADDDVIAGAFLLDFPGSIVRTSQSALAVDLDFTITACNGIAVVANQLPTGSPYGLTWFEFTVQAGAPMLPPPPNDGCINAVSIGTNGGTFKGTVAGATNDGSATCDPGGGSSRDVWYSYMNPNNVGMLLAVNTCGTSGMDTSLSIHTSCADPVGAACNDDCGGAPCAATSSCVSMIVAPSQTVRVRVSDKGLGGCGRFTLNATVDIPTPPNDSCTTPLALNGPGTFVIDTKTATTGFEGQAEALCLLPSQTAIHNDRWYRYTAAQSSTVTVSTCGTIAAGATEDSKIAIYAGGDCPVMGSAIACSDDAACPGFSPANATVSFQATCGSTFMIQMGTGTAGPNISGSFTVTETAVTPCPPPSFCTGDVQGTTCLACGNNGTAGRGCANSTFILGAQLTRSGNSSVSADTFVLVGSDLAGPCLFFQANGLATAPMMFGDGMLCASVGIIRMGVVFPVGGVASYPGGLTPNPIHIAGAPVNPGNTKHYQGWYRDAATYCVATTYNTTNGVSAVWGP